MEFAFGSRGLTSLTFDGFEFVPRSTWHGLRGYGVKQLPKNGPAIPGKDEYVSSELVGGGQTIAFTLR